MSYTPGPWKAETVGLIRQTRTDANIFCISYRADYKPLREERQANTCLIAAAPELLAMLKECAAILTDCEDRDELEDAEVQTLQETRALIAEAEGR